MGQRARQSIGAVFVTGIVIAHGVLAGWPSFAAAQEPAVVVETSAGDRARAISEAVLGQTVSLHLDRVRLKAALHVIAQQAGIELTYGSQEVPGNRVVTVVADRITVGDALASVLRGTRLKVTVWAPGRVRLEPSADSSERQEAGTITGRISDATTHAALDRVMVRVAAGAGLGATTDGDGRYTIHHVAPGAYRLTARRVGYAPGVTTVVVGDSTATVDFALAPVPATLEQVVTTGAGPQRRVELGNSIATINADSLVRTAPVTALTDVLSGRVPSVQVLPSSGIVGDGPAIRIRGQQSVTVSNDPIVIIDGVRINAAAGGGREPFGFLGSFTSGSRLNDVSPEEIESIDVLRGPSAATEYGTDAANGVIVIHTKHGLPGATRWELSTDQTLSTMPVSFPDNYFSWGHLTDGSNAPTPFGFGCVFANPFGLASQLTGTCAVDSVTRYQPLNHPATSEFGTGYRGRYGLQVSGGVAQLRYFVAGDYAGERGALQMPPAEVSRLERLRGAPVPNDQRNPNASTQTNIRSTLSGTLTHDLDATVSAAYLANSLRAPDRTSSLLSALTSPGFLDSLNGYREDLGYQAPGYIFAETGTDNVSRFTGGASATWRPRGWVSLRATVGIDQAARSTVTQDLPHQDPGSFYDSIGYYSRGGFSTAFYTADVGGTVMIPVSRMLTSKTAVGVQYYDRRQSGTEVAVTHIGLNAPTLNGATLASLPGLSTLAELKDESITLGSYVEETMSLAERLFVVGAIREDAASGFGSNYNVALYPKASVSWVAVPEDRHLLRFRAAYGQSGVQPQAGAALRLTSPQLTYVNGGYQVGYTVIGIGNPNLRPERSEEFEGGADIGVVPERLTLELTGYEKRSRDALINVTLPGSLGGTSVQENFGAVRNRGVEAQVVTRPIDSRGVAWDLMLGGSYNRNVVVRLAPGISTINGGLSFNSAWQQRAGFPAWGLWAYPVSYRDMNHDGRLELNEVSIGGAAVYVGPSVPTEEVSANTALSLFAGRIRVGAQLDYRGGYRVDNITEYVRSFDGVNRANNDPSAPLADQARAIAVSKGSFNALSPFLEDGEFARVREVSVTYVAPRRWAAALRTHSASITLSGRNLGLWTHYSGSDPEVNSIPAPVSRNGVATTDLNRDVTGDETAVPALRYYMLKLNLEL